MSRALGLTAQEWSDVVGRLIPDVRADPRDQLRMMRLYIEDRYGSSKKAKKSWKHHQ